MKLQVLTHRRAARARCPRSDFDEPPRVARPHRAAHAVRAQPPAVPAPGGAAAAKAPVGRRPTHRRSPPGDRDGRASRWPTIRSPRIPHLAERLRAAGQADRAAARGRRPAHPHPGPQPVRVAPLRPGAADPRGLGLRRRLAAHRRRAPPGRLLPRVRPAGRRGLRQGLSTASNRRRWPAWRRSSPTSTAARSRRRHRGSRRATCASGGRPSSRWPRELREAEEEAGLPPTRAPDPTFVAIAHAWAAGSRSPRWSRTRSSRAATSSAPSSSSSTCSASSPILAPSEDDAARGARRCAERLFRGVVAASTAIDADDVGRNRRRPPGVGTIGHGDGPSAVPVTIQRGQDWGRRVAEARSTSRRWPTTPRPARSIERARRAGAAAAAARAPRRRPAPHARGDGRRGRARRRGLRVHGRPRRGAARRPAALVRQPPRGPAVVVAGRGRRRDERPVPRRVGRRPARPPQRRPAGRCSTGRPRARPTGGRRGGGSRGTHVPHPGIVAEAAALELDLARRSPSGSTVGPWDRPSGSCSGSSPTP